MGTLLRVVVALFCMDLIGLAFSGARLPESGLAPGAGSGIVNIRHGWKTVVLESRAGTAANARRCSYLATETLCERKSASEFKRQRIEDGQSYGWVNAYVEKYHPETGSTIQCTQSLSTDLGVQAFVTADAQE